SACSLRAATCQVCDWTAVGCLKARSEHALVIAPTGSGKTLAAFLYALDRLFREGGEDTREAHKRKTSRILYISPIKALGTDV
ncbi:DEAD/DEAH box helicase, partial [Escherichia coli]|uniref:DEAD/DEAH box helicase n=1 Tax=Escherichia coli TaxID=562 RepID=UPI002026D59F